MEAAQTRLHEIDAMVTDSRMPGLSGRELVAQVRALRPELPILVVSGGYDEAAGRALDDAHTVYLCKPLSPDQLTIALRKLLYGTM